MELNEKDRKEINISDVKENEIAIEENKIVFLEKLYDFLFMTKEFKVLAGKTQVLNRAFVNPELELTTRMMHDLQVSRNAGKIAEKMGLSYEEQLLAKIIGLVHDIGHTPFGHDGEEVLRKEVEKFRGYYTFSHEEYGAEIFDTLLDEFISLYKKVPSDINEIRRSIKEGIRNHSQYYDYRANENNVQKCARLADILSFMISDLSDLLKGKDEKGKTIITRKRVAEICNQLKNGITNEEIHKVLNVLEAGGGGLAILYDEVIDEIFLEKDKETQPVIISDDYKLLQDIDDAYDLKPKNLQEVFSRIIIYYEYLVNHSDIAIENDFFVTQILTFLGQEEKAKGLENLNQLLAKMQSSELTNDELEIIEAICANLKPDIIAEKQAIIEEEMQKRPKLITLFTIQDTIQYREILAKNKSVLGNELVDDKMKKIYDAVLRMAYFTEQKGEGEERLQLHAERRVPRISYWNFRVLEYTIYVIQQMQNKDFDNDRVIELIMQELRITKEEKNGIDKIDMEDIYDSARKTVIENYAVNSISELTELNPQIEESAIKEIMEATCALNSPTITHQNDTKDGQ